LKGIPLEIGGTANHVHLLVRMPPMVSLAQLAQEMKGAASHLVNHEIAPGSKFRWQGAYAALSVEAERVAGLRAYIRNQKQHHALENLLPDWERCEE
jgi:REP element-mobilizing transposase RayT